MRPRKVVRPAIFLATLNLAVIIESRRLTDVGWFERARKATAGQRVTWSDRQQAMGTFAEFNALNAERQRLMREGLVGVATIVGIHQNVATTMLGTWHELELDVQLPNRDHTAARSALRSSCRRPRISRSVPRCRCESIPGTIQWSSWW